MNRTEKQVTLRLRVARKTIEVTLPVREARGMAEMVHMMWENPSDALVAFADEIEFVVGARKRSADRKINCTPTQNRILDTMAMKPKPKPAKPPMKPGKPSKKAC